MIRTTDKPGEAKLRAELEDKHRAWLDGIGPRLIAAGAVLHDDGRDSGGGLYLVEAANRNDAQAFIAADPMHRAGLFAEVAIDRWRKAYVLGKNLLSQDAP